MGLRNQEILGAKQILEVSYQMSKVYQVDLPARIFKKFARGETELSLSYVLRNCSGRPRIYKFLNKA